MAFTFTFWELFQAIILSVVVGWIFKDMFNTKKFKTPEDYIKASGFAKKFDWDSFWFAVALVAPSIIFHELGHKLSAMAFGLNATFHAAWLWLGLGILMKLIGGFVFFVPAFVAISGSAPAWVFGVTAFSGPLVNFILFGIAKVVPWFKQTQLKHRLKKKEVYFWVLLAKINLFLGIFNLIPIPGFDGYQVIRALLSTFFG